MLAKKHFPDIKVPIDVIKSDAIERLVNSASFSRTHQQVERLQEIFEELTADDALKILGSMVANKQISWIADDDDVKAFYLPLYKKFYSKTPVELDEALCKIAEYFDIAPF